MQCGCHSSYSAKSNRHTPGRKQRAYYPNVLHTVGGICSLQKQRWEGAYHIEQRSYDMHKWTL